MKVKAMIKLIEEDADSFAKRAEMYYKKRPELMKLVEEFYRAYRALAERYDHATGALRHAHRTMSEAFPNHIPLALPDESLTNNTPETPSPRRAMFDADDPQKDAFGVSTHFNGTLKNREGVARVKLPEGIDLKALNVHEQEVTARVRLPEGKVRKSLNFEEEEEEYGPTAKIYIDSKSHLQPEHKQKEDFQEQVSQLSNENQMLKVQIELESKYLDLSKTEVQNLRDEMSKLETEKDAAILQKQLSHESISSLEIEISKLEIEVRNQAESNKILQQEFESLKNEKNEMDQNHQSLTKHIESLETQVKDLQYEKLLFLDKLKELGSVSERNSVLENSLSDANAELEELRGEIVVLKGSCESLNAAVSVHVGEKTALAFQIETLAGKVEKLSDKNKLLENSLADANSELEGLRAKLRDLEESFHFLSQANSDLIAQKNDLISQVRTF